MFYVQCLQANAEKIIEVLLSLQNRPQIPKRYKSFLRCSGTFRLCKGNFYLFSRFLSLFLPLSNKNLTLHFPLHPPASPWGVVAMELLPLDTVMWATSSFSLFFSKVAACSSLSSHCCVRMTILATTLEPEMEAMVCSPVGESQIHTCTYPTKEKCVYKLNSLKKRHGP